MFGRLSVDALPHDLITIGGAVTMLGGALLVVAALTFFKRWKWLFKEWLTSLDPKKIGVMYLIIASIMLLRGVGDALLMRTQQALASDAAGILSSDHFQQIFSAHGTIMIFFVAMGLIFGLFNLLVPLQIGSRDVAFPFLNSVSFWLFAVGFGLVNLSLIVGEFSAAGWLAYPPLSELQYSPGVGVDYWIWSLQIAGVGSLLSGINFFVTILKMRAPGMTLMKMPVFIWSVLGSLVLIMFAFPILTATLGMLSLDRLIGAHFFTTDAGGNAMMYINLIWAWGHPEVYILILPAFGIFSEVVATFSRKRLFGYTSMVWAIAAIAFLSFTVWLHHFFTMGAGANVNAFFGIMTMVIAIPTGVKVFNWLFTMYRGRVKFATPMLWFMGFIVTFTLGGLAGVLMSVPAIDFQVHNSLFLVAHFHTMIIGGVVFGCFAGFTYWFPKFTGFTLNERLGRYAFWSWLVGFLLAFTPLYILGFMGATRRLDHYDASMGWQGLFVVAGIGVLFIGLGIFFQLLQLGYSIWKRNENRVQNDPWNGRTLEWAVSSPPPEYNFATIPEVSERDAYWMMKQTKHKTKPFKGTITIPKNSPLGFIIAVFAFMIGFGIVWHMFWMAGIGLVGIIVCIIVRISSDETERQVAVNEMIQEKGSRA
ncbi:MAG TPA: cytochrome o ubiquinol oxidase subunit I [Candidatus Saccharimonadales bacterium]|nr:cytochrome o ubiquinol oxidase subunit I [Candidatus Saccharimonadales bacterium]